MTPESIVPSIVSSMIAAAGAGVALYGGQLMLRQRSIVFRPTREHTANPAGIAGLTEGLEQIFIPTSDGVYVHGWWIAPGADRPLVLFLPGSVGNISHELTTVAFLISLGLHVFIVDYPGFGLSEGRPSEAGCYRTALAAWRHAVDDRGVNPKSIVAFGRSLGATVAARLAAERECRALVLHSGLTSVPDVAARAYPILPARYFCVFRFNTLKYVRQCRCPVLVLHPAADQVIPFAHGGRIFDAANPPKRFVALRGDHYGSEWQSTPGLRAVLSDWIAGSATACA